MVGDCITSGRVDDDDDDDDNNNIVVVVAAAGTFVLPWVTILTVWCDSQAVLVVVSVRDLSCCGIGKRGCSFLFSCIFVPRWLFPTRYSGAIHTNDELLLWVVVVVVVVVVVRRWWYKIQFQSIERPTILHAVYAVAAYMTKDRQQALLLLLELVVHKKVSLLHEITMKGVRTCFLNNVRRSLFLSFLLFFQFYPFSFLFGTTGSIRFTHRLKSFGHFIPFIHPSRIIATSNSSSWNALSFQRIDHPAP